MTLEQMLDDLPKACDRGAKINAQGFSLKKAVEAWYRPILGGIFASRL